MTLAVSIFGSGENAGAFCTPARKLFISLPGQKMFNLPVAKLMCFSFNPVNPVQSTFFSARFEKAESAQKV